jgi:predicted alpha/beta hydrolase family esterase
MSASAWANPGAIEGAWTLYLDGAMEKRKVQIVLVAHSFYP